MQVYKTTNLVNGKWYIGKSKYNNPNYLGSGKLIRRAVEKYGRENFVKEILEECTSLAHLNEQEIFWIQKTGATQNNESYNIANGGDGGDWTHAYSKEVSRIYSTRDLSNNTMQGTKKWFSSLTKSEKDEFHRKQAASRSKKWLVSRVDNPSCEILITNINQWCKENVIDSAAVSRISDPRSNRYGKMVKGWRIRRDGDPELPPYENKQKDALAKNRNNRKGKTWKLVDGVRVWFERDEK